MAKKILIMEDEKVLQTLLEEKLKKHGYEVMAVDDGERGMEVIKDYKPDLILLDMMMPKVDGFGVLEQMKENDLTSSFPVIVISNSGQPVEIERALSLGVIDYIIKVDFDPAEVVEKVKAFFANPTTANIEERSEEEEEEEEEEIGGLEAEVARMNGQAGPEGTEVLKGAGIKVLLVEDDDFLRGICELKLKKEGFDVVTAADGLDALKKIQEGEYHLVLLDVILPGMDGFDILANVKKDPIKSKIPIIMLTNMGQETEIKKGFDLGADDYIIKAHFTVGEIIEKIKGLIDKKNIGGTSAV